MIVVLATLLSAAAFYLSQGLDNVWALAWFAPAPILWLAYRKTPVWQVAVAAIAAMLASMIYVAQCYSMLPWGILSATIGLQAALFTTAVLFAGYINRHAPPLLTLFAFPVFWTAIEYLTELVSPNGTYGSFAYSQMSAPFLIQSASLFGLYSITFLLCLFANAIAMAFAAPRDSMAAVGLGLAICAANVGFGVERLAEAQPRSVRVAAMVDESTITKASHMGTQDAAVEISRTYAKAIRSTGAKFAVTPEGGIFTRPQWRLTVLAPLAAVSKQEGIQIIAGVLQRKPWGDLAYSITPDGMVQSYAKRHPVPGLEDNFTPGHASGWLGQGRAMEICKDMDFPDTIRRDAVKGVRLMGEPAGDFGIDGWLHARMSVMRGVEDGFALVRAANDGWVTASDAEGRLIASKVAAPTGLTMIVANLPFGPGPTLYARIGDVFAWLCIAASLGIAAYALRIASRIGGIGVHGWPGQARP